MSIGKIKKQIFNENDEFFCARYKDNHVVHSVIATKNWNDVDKKDISLPKCDSAYIKNDIVTQINGNILDIFTMGNILKRRRYLDSNKYSIKYSNANSNENSTNFYILTDGKSDFLVFDESDQKRIKDENLAINSGKKTKHETTRVRNSLNKDDFIRVEKTYDDGLYQMGNDFKYIDKERVHIKMQPPKDAIAFFSDESFTGVIALDDEGNVNKHYIDENGEITETEKLKIDHLLDADEKIESINSNNAHDAFFKTNKGNIIPFISNDDENFEANYKIPEEDFVYFDSTTRNYIKNNMRIDIDDSELMNERLFGKSAFINKLKINTLSNDFFKKGIKINC